MKASRERSRAGGFTLLETMIALVIMALGAAVMYGSLRLAAKSWDAGEAKLEESAHARLAQTFLRTHLTQHYPLRLRGTAEQPLFFRGGSDALQFASHLPDRVAVGGMFLMRLELADDSGKRRLILKRVIPDGPVSSETGFDEADVSVLAEDVESLRIQYYASANETEEPRWLDRWEDPQRLPLLIRIDVAPRHALAWPALVIEPKLGVEVGCAAWDASRQRCAGG